MLTFSLFSVLVLLLELDKYLIPLYVMNINPNVGAVVIDLVIDLRKFFSQITLRTLLSMYIFSIALTPTDYILSLVVFQIWSNSFKNVPRWLPMLLIVLSNDIHLNPGPQSHFQNNYLNFMNWNLNSLTKDNFRRVDLIEAHNSIFYYDLIHVCEINLNDSIELPETLLQDYTFVPANHPSNMKHGGVGLFYKNSLPVNVRHDLSFNDSIVV